MLCDVCQTRQAKIFYTEIVNGQKKEQHLCEQCASEYTAVPLNELLGGAGLSSVGSILSGILSSYAKGKSMKNVDHKETVCPECGNTESEFLKTERAGCPVCYNVFSDMIAKNFKAMQGGMTHTGKEPAFAKLIEIKDVVPQSSGKKGSIGDINKMITLDADDDPADKETAAAPEDGEKVKKKGRKTKSSVQNVSELKEKLKEALKVEDYELAAKLRDEIKSLEVKNEKKKK